MRIVIDSPCLDVLKIKGRVIDFHTLCFNGIQIKIGSSGNVETLYKLKSILLSLSGTLPSLQFRRINKNKGFGLEHCNLNNIL